EQVLLLDEALTRLVAVRPQAAELVKLRFFSGLTTEEAAPLLGLSPRTARRLWVFARAWLRRDLGRSAEASPRGARLPGVFFQESWPLSCSDVALSHKMYACAANACGVGLTDERGVFTRGIDLRAGPGNRVHRGACGVSRPGLWPGPSLAGRGRGPSAR